MNRKGQSLIIFILCIPIIMICASLIVDLALVSLENSKLNNIASEILKDSMKKDLTDYQVRELIRKNDKTITIVKYSNNEIYLKKEIKPIFGKIIGYNNYQIKSHLKIEIINDSISIKKLELG